MISPTEADIGRKVLVREYWEQDHTKPPKEGIIVGLDPPYYVTIQFTASKEYDLARPRDLEWAP